MVSLGGTAVFYAVLVAPGFVAVMTAISLSAIEDDISQFVLLVWSLVSSLFIDTIFLAVYQCLNEDIESTTNIGDILFTPNFRADYIAAVFLFSIFIGIIYGAIILADLQGRLRRSLQSRSHISYNPRQPWENFMRDAKSIRIKTEDDQLYAGNVKEWSRAGRDREVRIGNPHRYQPKIKDYEPVGREDMIFFDDNIDRVLTRAIDRKNRGDSSGQSSTANETEGDS